MIQASHFSRRDLPKFSKILKAESGSDVIVIGYPMGHFDTYNRFPILKSGIIASGWGMNFNEERIFKIDTQLFPVSSGSPVILKPTRIIVRDDGKISTYNSTSPAKLLLGIYAGEFQQKITESCMIEKDQIKEDVKITKNVSLGIGNVFYADLIDEIILNPLTFHEMQIR